MMSLRKERDGDLLHENAMEDCGCHNNAIFGAHDCFFVAECFGLMK